MQPEQPRQPAQPIPNNDMLPSIPVNNITVQQPAIISAAPPHGVNKNKERFRSVLSTLMLIIIAPLLALTINAFIFQSYEVDGPSMEHTLQNQDRLIVNKMGKTWSRITGDDFIPKRGTVIVFKKPNIDTGLNNSSQKNLIKRVIGIPGDRVIIKDGKVTIINQDHPDGYNPDENTFYSSTYTPPTNGNVDITVPAGEVFVCGDNRGNSLDSRYFGTVKSKDILGSLSLRIYPFNKLANY